MTPLERMRSGADLAPRLRARQLEASGIPIERAAGAITLSLETGLDPDLVGRNYDAIAAARATPDFDPERFARESPIVAAWLAERPGRMALAQRDTAPLGQLERLLGRWDLGPVRAIIPGVPLPVPVPVQTQRGLVQEEYRRSQWANAAGRLGWQVALGAVDLADPTQRAEAEQRFAEASRELPAAAGMFERLVRGSASLAPSLINSLASGAEGAVVGAAAGAAAGALAGGAPALATAPTGAAVGGLAGAFLASAEVEGGLLTLKLLLERDAGDRAMDPALARTAGLAYGISAGVLDVIGVGAIAKPFGKAGAQLAQRAVREALAVPTTRDALVQGVKDWALAVGTEATTETAQQAVQLWMEQMASQTSNLVDDTTFDPVTLERTVRELAGTFTETIVGMALLAVPGGATTTLAQLARVQQAAQDQRLLTALGETTEAVSFRAQLPEALREVAEAITANGPVRDLAIPIERFNVYWQEQGLDPADVAAQLFGDTRPYEQAMALGTADLVIPLPVYVEKLAGTVHHAPLSIDLRLRPGALTARESQMLLKRDAVLDEQLRAEARQLVQDATADPASAAVYDTTRQALEATGRYTPEQADAMARIDQAFFARLAPVFGTDAFSLYERTRGGVVGPDVAEPLFDAIKQLQRAERKGDAAAVATARAEVERLSGLAMAERRQAAPVAPLDPPGAPATPAEVDATLAERARRDAEVAAAREAAKPTKSARDARGRLKTKLTQVAESELLAEYVALEDARQADLELAASLPEIESLLESTSTGRPIGYAGARRLFGTAEDARRWQRVSEEAVGALSERGLTPQDVNAMMQARDRLAAEGGPMARLKAELDRRGIDPMQQRVDEADTSFDPKYFMQAPSGEVAETARAYGGQAAWQRAVAAGRTQLAYEQWVQVRTPAFKQAFGDWEAAQHAEFLQGPAVATLSLDEAPTGPFKAVVEWARALFASQGGEAVHPELGPIVLDARAAKDSLGHGHATTAKRVAFRAVQRVIERGVVVHRAVGKDFDSFYIAAPVEISGKETLVTVLARKRSDRQRMYLHAVTVKEHLLATRESAAGAEAPKPHGPLKPGDLWRLLAALLRVKPEPSQGEINPATGEPMGDRLPPLLAQGTGRPNAFILPGTGRDVIALMKTANPSSFVHELGHEYLEVMADAAARDDAPQWVRDDWQTILQFLEVTDRAAIGTAQHERWARAWEGWLSTGQAPSEALFSAFARFKVWMKAVYRAARELLGLQGAVTPALEAVFQRLLASEEEIAAAQRAVTTPLVFPTAEAARATEAEWSAMLAARDAALQRADASLTARLLDEQRKASLDWWQAERARVRSEVEAEVMGEPDQQAAHFLRTGMLLDGAPLPDGVAPMKLAREALTARYGPDVVKSLPRGVLAPKGVPGVDPDLVAALFGIPSGDQLVAALQAVEPMGKRIERLTDERMQAAYPDLLKDSGALAEAAQDAIHADDAQAEVLVAELRLLGRQSGTPITEAIDTLRAQVETDVRSLPLLQVSPFRFQQAEAKAGRMAYDAARRQDFAAAQFWKRKQLLNHLYYRAARDAVQQAERIERRTRKFEQPGVRARLGKSGPEYLEQIDALLERYEFRRVGEPTLGKRESLLAWVERQQAAGQLVQLDERLLTEARRTNYRQLTLDELEAVDEALRQIDHLSRTKTTLLAAKAERDFDATVEAIVTAIGEHHTITDEAFDYRPGSVFTKVADAAKVMDAAHVRPEFLFRWLDGDRDLGPVHQALFQPLADAEAAETRMYRDAATDLESILGRVGTPKARARWFSERIPVDPSFQLAGNTVTRSTLIALALNWGNEGNRDAIRDGHHWTDTQVATLLRQLTAAEWEMVQELWNLIDGYWPQIAELQREMTGLVPAKVERVPFTVRTADGQDVQLAGGYYPLKYDAKRSSLVNARETKANVKELFGTNHIGPQTRKGHTIERTASGGLPVALDLNVLSSHLQNVIHDLTHRRALLDTVRLLQDERVKRAIEGSAGKAIYRRLEPWLVSIASDRRDPAGDGERIAAHARVGATVVNMGWKATTALTQVLGFLQSVEVLGTKWTAEGIRAFVASPAEMKATADLVLEKSEAMRNRRLSFDRDVRDLFKRLEQAGPLSGVQQSFFYATGMMDMMVAVPTWLGAYRKSLETMAPGDDTAAVAYADMVVRLSQGSGSAKDLAAIQRGSEYHRLFTMFYSYFSVLYNLMRRSIDKRVVNPETRDLPRFAASMLVLWFAPAVLGELLVDRGPDDDEDPLEWAAWRMAKYPLSAIVGVRDVVQAMGPDAYSYELTPAATAFKTLVGTGNTALGVAGALAQGEPIDVDRSDYREAVMALGYWAHLPSRQMWITGEYVYRWTTGEDVPGSASEAARGLLFAPPQ